jgi:GNAT superfamily N-acetyltransferase
MLGTLQLMASLGQLKDTMHIRPYQADDYDAVIELHYAGLDEHGVNRGLGPWDDDLADIDATYHRAGGIFLVGHIEGELIAMGALFRVDEQTGEIKRMRVRSDHRRKGYGQMIIDALVRFAENNGLGSLVLDTTDKQRAAQSLYLKNGFAETRREKDEDVVNVYYRRNLPNKSIQRTSPRDADSL